MQNLPSQDKIQHEMEKAVRARYEGLEGKARVCARRAAGFAAQDYLTRLQGVEIDRNTLDSLNDLSMICQGNLEIKNWIEHLMMRVDEMHHLPPDIDIIDDANQLIKHLKEG